MKKSIAVLAWVFVGCLGFALPRAMANLGNESSDLGQSATHFVENLGQIHDQNDAPNPEVLFLYNGNGLNVQLRKSGFSYDVWQAEAGQNENASEESKPQKFRFHRIDLDFENANPNYTVETEGKSKDYLNFYGFSSAPEGVTRVHHYEKVVYKNVWKNIDMAFFITPNGFKYDIVVRPGGNPADAVFSVKGADDITNQKGELVLHNTLTPIQENIPEIYTLLNGQKSNTQGCFKILENNRLGIELDAPIPPNATLVFDPFPNIEWGTYIPGSSARSATIDGNGDMIIIGRHTTYAGLATFGAFQGTIVSNNTTSFVFKMDNTGNRVWATFYNGWEIHDITSDKNNYLIFVGMTNICYNNNLSTSGAHQTICHSGKFNGVIAKFTPTGGILWVTYYGGINNTRVTSCSVDTANNIFIAGYSGDDSTVATSGAHQTSNGGGYNNSWDAILVKFDENGVRLWGTFFGGSNLEYESNCKTDEVGNVYLFGVTRSTDGIASVNAHQPNRRSEDDAYLAKFDGNGVLQWGTYFGGNRDETANDICVNDTLVFLVGNTKSDQNLVSPGQSFGTKPSSTDHWDGYVAQFTQSGNLNWAMYYGAIGNQDLTGILSNDKGFSIVGYTNYSGSLTNNQLATSGAHQEEAKSQVSGFVAEFEVTSNLRWASYFGGYSNDVINGICQNEFGEKFIYGGTASNNYIATSGTYHPNYPNQFSGFVTKYHCEERTSSFNMKSCNFCHSPSGKYLWLQPGVYNDTLLASTGCDSVMTINLDLDYIDTTVTTLGLSLFSNQYNASYQWLNCNFMMNPIPGANKRKHIAPPQGGRFAVIVDDGNCMDTSRCYLVVPGSIGLDAHQLAQNVTIYPNPTTGDVAIDLSRINQSVRVEVINSLGQVLQVFTTDEETPRLQLTGPAGLYLIRLITHEGHEATFRVTKV